MLFERLYNYIYVQYIIGFVNCFFVDNLIGKKLILVGK